MEGGGFVRLGSVLSALAEIFVLHECSFYLVGRTRFAKSESKETNKIPYTEDYRLRPEDQKQPGNLRHQTTLSWELRNKRRKARPARNFNDTKQFFDVMYQLTVICVPAVKIK
jgi:hypothetical protein